MTTLLAVPESYQEDASGYKGHADALLTPQSTAEVREILREASARLIPVTLSGAGTGITGGRCAPAGWLLSLERFQTLEIQDGSARAGAGVRLRDVQAAAAPSRQFYAPDPTEWTASIGGTIANNASGSRSFRYGSTRRHVLGLTAVFMNGEVREFKRGDAVDFPVGAIPLPDTTKNSAGYLLRPGMDWIDLLCGSEGTLAVVTEAQLQLLPVPASLLSGVVFFRDEAAQLRATDEWRPVAGLRMLESFDRAILDLLQTRYPEIPREAGAALLIEQEAGDEAVDEWVDRLEAAEALAEASWFGTTAADRERFRAFRHSAPEMVNDLVRRRGFQKLGSDFAVPLARNRDMLEYYCARLDAELPGKYVKYGHIGDAHVHVNMLPSSPEEDAVGRRLMDEFARQSVRFGGTVSAEHGLGKKKAHFLEIQYAPEHIEAMKAVKRRLDPQWLLGRGTLFEPELPVRATP